jgi:hypothetical protein
VTWSSEAQWQQLLCCLSPHFLYILHSFLSFMILHLFISCIFSVFSLSLYFYLFIYSIIHRTPGIFSWRTHSSFVRTESKCTIYKVTRRLVSMERFSAFEAALKCVINSGFKRYIKYRKHNLKKLKSIIMPDQKQLNGFQRHQKLRFFL